MPVIKFRNADKSGDSQVCFASDAVTTDDAQAAIKEIERLLTEDRSHRSGRTLFERAAVLILNNPSTQTAVANYGSTFNIDRIMDDVATMGDAVPETLELVVIAPLVGG